ncbi:MAG TPA: hypothetical protein VMH85_15510 [Terriglobales bacterium]|nr:hypothetical protein [Terriglobales bacterium]
MRFLPVSIFAFRVWEGVWRDSGGPGPFKPGLSLVKLHSYGDLASFGNLKTPRDYRDEAFQVDKLGFRNSPRAAQPRPGGLMVGDSFAVASSVPQDMTLPEQLTKLGDIRIYNAGARDMATPPLVRQLASRLNMTSGVVIYELLERRARVVPQTPVEAVEPSLSETLPPNRAQVSALSPAETHPWLSTHPLAKTIFQKMLRLLQHPSESVHRYDSRSPVKIVSRKLMKDVQNDVVLPNVYAHQVVRFTLKNNDEMLFYPIDFTKLGDVNTLDSAWVSYLSGFAEQIAEQNLRLVVLLVPNKFTVYGPLTKGPTPKVEGVLLLASLQKALASAGICAVDLTPIYQRSAAESLSQRQYLYWRDDTHWNSRGIGVAAHALMPCVETSRQGAVSTNDILRNRLPMKGAHKGVSP